jgi:hypothetical protein
VTQEPDLPDPDPDEIEEPGEDEDRRYPSTIGGAFYLAILVVCGAGIAVVAGGDWRLGLRVLAAGLMFAAGLRLVLPARDAGMLAVRHRAIDVTVLAAMGGFIWFLAGDIPDQPG